MKDGFTKNFIILFSGNSLGQIIPFLFASLLGRLFDANEMAVYANFLALVSLISIVGSARYEKALVLPAEKEKAMNLLSLSLRILIVVTLISFFLYFFRSSVDTFYEKVKMSHVMIFVVIAIPLFTLNNLFTDWLVRFGKFKAITISGIARSVFVNLFGIFFGYFSYGAEGLIYGALIGYAVSFVLMLISSLNDFDFSLVSPQGRKSVAKEYKDFPLINSAHAFIDILLGQFVLYWIITKEYGSAELGWYSVMFRYLLGSMRAVGGATGQLYYKEASDRVSSGETILPAMWRSMKLVLFFALPLCIAIGFFGPQLFAIYFGEGYRVSGEIAQIMIVPLFINFLISPVSGTPIMYRKQGVAFVLSLFGYSSMILSFIICNYYQMDFFQALKFVAITQTIYYLILFFWYLHLAKRGK